MVGLSKFGVRRSQWRPLLAGLLKIKVVLSTADGGKLCVLLNVLGYETWDEVKFPLADAKFDQIRCHEVIFPHLRMKKISSLR